MSHLPRTELARFGESVGRGCAWLKPSDAAEKERPQLTVKKLHGRHFRIHGLLGYNLARRVLWWRMGIRELG